MLRLNKFFWSLNPCSNGRCSARARKCRSGVQRRVLILVLMEDALRADVELRKFGEVLS